MNESGHNRKILKKKSKKRIIVINTVKEAANTRIKSKDVGERDIEQKRQHSR